MTNSTKIDSRELRNALGSFATGVAIVTTSDGDHDVGMTINSFSSVSLDPPMVLWSLAKSSPSLKTFKDAGYFAIHVLAAEQEDVSQRFATRGIDKFEGVSVSRGEGNVPILEGSAAVFHCKTNYCYEGGDHEIFVGEVLKFEHFQKQPLVFHAGKYSFAVAKTSTQTIDPTGGFGANSLTYLMGLVYFQLAQKAATEMAKRGINECEMGVLNVVAMNDNSSAANIDGLMSASGLRVTDEVLQAMANKNLLVLNEATPAGASLTDHGRQLLVEMIAFIQATEDEALPNSAHTEISVAKDLLKKTALNLLKP